MSGKADVQGRLWDSFDVYLFDIDGTLLNCTDATHYFAFRHALELLSGRPLTLDGVVAHGNVDNGILRDALTLAGIPKQEWGPRLGEAHQVMSDYMESRQHEICTTVLPQIRETLQHLSNRGASLGVASGNLEKIGRLKLQKADLLRYFQFGSWSDAHETRSAVIRAGIAEARRSCGPECSLCVVGDTPFDISSAHENEVPVIAVATGIFSYEELQREKADLCIRSFEGILEGQDEDRKNLASMG